jgi:hypothetical protein
MLFAGKKPVASGICTFVDNSVLPCMVYSKDDHYLIIGLRNNDVVVVLEVWGENGKATKSETLWIEPNLTI